MSRPVVAILIVNYEQPELLRDCLHSLRCSLTEPLDYDIRRLVVDNASKGFDTAALATEFPECEFLCLPENRGFAGGNNAGWQQLVTTGAVPDFLVLLNPDTLLEPGWLSPLLQHLADHLEVAAVQPLIVLHPETDRINTLGNDCHYLGFGLLRGYRDSVDTAPQSPVEIASFSGAACVLRGTVITELGLFDERYFLYLEDTELSWKLRFTGHTIALVPMSRVFHRFRFQAPYRRYRNLERNRWWLLLAYYRWSTLLLILPMAVLMDLGQWVFALRHGLIQQRCLAAWDVFRPAHWQPQWRARRLVQQRRRISDRELTRPFTATFPESLLPGFLVQRIANPLCAVYWSIVRRFLR